MLNFGQQQVGGENTAPATQAPVPTPLPAPAAMTVNDLYTQVLGRAPDAGGLAYWQNAFGTGAVTPEQQASFMQAAQGELAQRSAADQQQLAPNLVNTTSPATQATTLAPVAPPPPTPPVMTVNDLYTQILGRAPDAGGLAYWQNAFGGDVDPTEQASFMQAAQAELARRPAADQQQLAPNLVNTSTTGATTGGIDTLLTNQTAATTAAADAAAKAKLGIFQKVYDPKTGREFVSPAQALQYGVTDYVTKMPSDIALPTTTQNAINTWLAKPENIGKTTNDALTSLAAQYGMTPDELRNYEIQGTIRSADRQVIKDAVDT
jgi:hypothetical protein